MEKVTFYKYSVSRNKNAISQTKLKKELLIEKKNRCYICNEEYNNYNLELEHKIPIMLCGDVINKPNLDIVCQRCHIKKTKIDIKIISGLKKMNILSGKWEIKSIWSKEELQSFYLTQFDRIKIMTIYLEQWDVEATVIPIKNNLENGSDMTGQD